MKNAIETRALRKVYPAPKERMKKPDASSVEDGRRQPQVDVIALDALDLDVREGELFGMIGPNGAGKTTTIGSLTTRVRPTSGTATWSGPPAKGWLFQTPNSSPSVSANHQMVPPSGLRVAINVPLGRSVTWRCVPVSRSQAYCSTTPLWSDA